SMNDEVLVRFEDKLNAYLDALATIDGHDCGASEFNVFILTNEPVAAFKKAHYLAESHGLPHQFRAAYRELTGEEYVILWPPTLREFAVT
ncbi:MAG TPA: hypothetical protein VFW94_21855, partial [Candidatus Acidoferrales bacterium]|nr:hypothetical protein [Candidatus Acidoferrales bacterium]